MRVRVSVPAGSANLGPGFDCLALAVNLYNEIEIQITPGRTRVVIDEGYNIPADLLLTALARVRTTGSSGLTIRCRNRIPPGRGLGSSAAAVLSGITAGLVLGGLNPDQDTLLALAADMEGHWDNAAAAVYGGLCSVVTGGGARRLPLADGWQVVLAIPRFELATAAAREQLPGFVEREAAVHNLGRVAVVAAALAAGDDRLLEGCDDDRLHQEYRLAMIPGGYGAIGLARDAGARFVVVSGSGPTLLALVRDRAHDVGRAMIRGFGRAGVPARYVVTTPATQGIAWTGFEFGQYRMQGGAWW